MVGGWIVEVLLHVKLHGNTIARSDDQVDLNNHPLIGGRSKIVEFIVDAGSEADVGFLDPPIANFCQGDGSDLMLLAACWRLQSALGCRSRRA